jgi:lysophospholipase L1-like esterase
MTVKGVRLSIEPIDINTDGVILMILCLGDSLTFGSVGYSYIQFLRPEIITVNKGINGDTTVGAYKRLQKYIVDPKYSAADTYVVFIGVNDILASFLCTLSPVWWLQMKPRIYTKKCLTDDNAFKSEYEKILKLLESCGKKAILVGLPLIQIKGTDNGIYLRRNEIIKGLAEEHKLPYIDIYSLQQAALTAPLKEYSWGFTGLFRIIDDALMLFHPSIKARFEKERRLELTVDGCHFTSLSAKLLAKAIEDCIQ